MKARTAMTTPDNQVANRNPDGTFIKGCSGNLQGRPRGSVTLASRLQALLAECPEGADAETWAEQIVRATLADALNTDGQSRRLVWEYCCGKPTQAIEVDLPGVEVVSLEATVALYASTFALMLEGDGQEP